MNKKLIEEQARDIVQKMPDELLAATLIELVDMPRNPDTNSVRIWLLDEIETRFQDVNQAMEDYYLSGKDDEFSYSQRIVQMLKVKFNQ
jgi:hypothetical protein